MAKSKLFLVVTIILSTSSVEPKAIAKDAPYPPAGFRPQGRAFNLPGEEEILPTTTETFLETTTAFEADLTTTEFPEGVNRLGRSFDEDDDGEEKVLTTIKPGIAQYKENGEKVEIVYAVPASDSLKLGTDEINPNAEETTSISPDDEVTTFAPVDSEHKLIEEGATNITKLYPVEGKLGELRISDEEVALKEEDSTPRDDEVTTFAPVNEEETADLKAQVETIDPEEISDEAEKLVSTQEPTLEEKSGDDIDPLKAAEKEQAEENEARAQEALDILLGSTKDADEEEGSGDKVVVVAEEGVLQPEEKVLLVTETKDSSVASGEKVLLAEEGVVVPEEEVVVPEEKVLLVTETEDSPIASGEKVLLDPALPPETKFERFYLVNNDRINDFEYIQQYYDQSAKDEPLVISQQEVLVPADQPFVYSAQVQRWVS